LYCPSNTPLIDSSLKIGLLRQRNLTFKTKQV
jgi:hypothetical protein